MLICGILICFILIALCTILILVLCPHKKHSLKKTALAPYRRRNKFVTQEFYNQADVQKWMKAKKYVSDHQRLRVDSQEIIDTLIEQFHLLIWFQKQLPEDCYTVLFFGAALGYEAARSMLPYDDDLDLLMCPKTHQYLLELWNQAQSVPKKDIPAFYKNKRNLPWDIRYFPGFSNLWLLHRRNHFKLMFKNNRVYGPDIGGLDLFPFDRWAKKPLPIPTKDNSLVKNMCGYNVRMFNTQTALSALDTFYGKNWRLKILPQYK